jgi:hypothetical protein
VESGLIMENGYMGIILLKNETLKMAFAREQHDREG